MKNNNKLLFRPQQNPSVIEILKKEYIELQIPGQSQTNTLNFSANAVWGLCNGQRSIYDISIVLARHFDLAITDIYPEIEKSIAELQHAGLLTLDNPDEKPGHHPDTNIDEGHLGGYIRGRQSAETTVYEYEHGDPATWRLSSGGGHTNHWASGL